MARSVGEAAALGLDSGLRLGLDIQGQRKAEERQARLDQQAQEDRAFNRGRLTLADSRQADADAAVALEGQQGELAREAQSYVDQGKPVPPEVQQRMTLGLGAITKKKGDVSARRGGVDIAALQQQAQAAKQRGAAAAQALAGGADTSQMSGDDLKAAIWSTTGLPHTDFLPSQDGQPSRVTQAMQAIDQGFQSGDTQAALKGFNFLLRPQLNAMVGTPSAHGGTIVRVELADLHPAPNSPPDSPAVIPMLKVFVKDDKATGPKMQDGSTGYYLAPLTEGRSTANDARVKAIPVKDGVNYVGQYQQVADILSHPEVQAKLNESGSTFDPTPFDAVLAGLGVKQPTVTTKREILPQGSSMLEQTFGKDGKLISERRIEGNPKDKKENFAAQTLQARLDAVDEDESLTPQQKAIEKRAIRSGIKPGKYTGDGGGGAGGDNPEKWSNGDLERLKSLQRQETRLQEGIDKVLLSGEAKSDAPQIVDANGRLSVTRAAIDALRSTYQTGGKGGKKPLEWVAEKDVKSDTGPELQAAYLKSTDPKEQRAIRARIEKLPEKEKTAAYVAITKAKEKESASSPGLGTTASPGADRLAIAAAKLKLLRASRSSPQEIAAAQAEFDSAQQGVVAATASGTTNLIPLPRADRYSNTGLGSMSHERR